MATKKAAKRPAARKKATTPKGVTVTRGRNLITITYGKPHEVLPHLLDLASDFAGKHFAKAALTPGGDDVLGADAAQDIVSGCANSDCWNCTLGDLKLDSDVFQTCVFNGVQKRGYAIGRNDIPVSQGTQLYTVVMAIQGAKKQGQK
jgi:hypothetical protein